MKNLIINLAHIMIIIFLCASVTKPTAIVTEHWFFITENVPKGQKLKNYTHPAKSRIVKNDQAFGVGVDFLSDLPSVKFKVQLTVPDKPENFPCFNCKENELQISEDRKTITVTNEVESNAKTRQFYWGIDENDPRGKYNLSLWLDGQQIETYEFVVE